MESCLPRSPSSAVVVTSIPRRRNPSAMAGSTCSSRWNRIVLGIEFREFLRQLGGTGPGLHLGNEGFVVLHLPEDLVLVVPEIRQGRVDIRKRQLRELGDNLIGRLALEFVPHINVLHADSRVGDAGFATA